MSTPQTPEYVFAPHERPRFPGSPATPDHPSHRRWRYAIIGVICGLLASLSNALITVNISNLAGSLDLYLAQLSWLPAIYVAMNASANLTLVKARMQFGIPPVVQTLLLLFLATTLWQLAFPGFTSAIIQRAVSGMQSAVMSSVTMYYLIQAFPMSRRPLALVIGIGMTQLSTPIARMLPVEMLVDDHWRGLHLVEVAYTLTLLALLNALPLPPSERSKAFEKLDLVTIALLVPAYVLICSVLGLGRVLWWTDTPWLGWMLVAAMPLLASAILVEHFRANPLIRTRWIGTIDILRFAAVVLLVRLALAEQSYGAVGLLTSGGLNNNQLRLLFACIGIAMLLGIGTAALTVTEQRIPYLILAAALIIALGAWIDTHVTSMTRPAQLMLSQSLIGFGATLFIGPAMIAGILRVIRLGGAYLISFIVLFSTTQNIGGLAGSALLGSYQIVSAREHAAALSEQLTGTNPVVMQRLQIGASSLAGKLDDPTQVNAEGAQLLGQAMNRQANVLAYIDAFRLIFHLALLTAAFVLGLILLHAWRRRRAAAAQPT